MIHVMTSGTLKTVTLANGTSFPVTKSLNVQANAAAAGHFLVVKQGSTEIESSAINNGAATLSHAWAKDTVYTVYLQDEDSNDIATGYSFKFTEASGDPDPDDPNSD